MNKRNQSTSGLIVDHFVNPAMHIPEWPQVYKKMKTYDINYLSGCQRFPTVFIQFLFCSNPNLQNRISELQPEHHYLISTLFKDYFKLETCKECGAFWKKCDGSDSCFFDFELSKTDANEQSTEATWI